jgi:hypothetical protein
MENVVLFYILLLHNCFHELLLSFWILNIFYCMYIQIYDTCSTVSTELPIVFGIPECTINFDTLDLFFGRPDNDSIESKHVAIKIFCVVNCCVWLKCIPCMKCGRTKQATDDTMAHTRCMLDIYGYKHTLRIYFLLFHCNNGWTNAPRRYIPRTMSVLLYFNEVNLMTTFHQVEACCQRECKELQTNKELCTRGQQCHLSIYWTLMSACHSQLLLQSRPVKWAC